MLEKIFSAIDIFGIPILLNFYKSKKAKSGFGGFCSLLFIGFIAWSIYNSGYELFAREKPQIIDGTTYSEIPRPMDISSKSLPLAFAVEINEQYIDKKFCHYFYYVGDDKTNTRELETCTSKHFVIKNDLIEDTYNLADYKCFPIDPEFTATSTFTVRAICPNQQGIEDFFAQQLEATVIYPINGLTMSNYDNPVKLYFDADYLPLVADTDVYSTWSLSHLSILTDDGWITSDEKVNQYIQVQSVQDRNYRDVIAPGVEYLFTVTQQEVYYVRSYKRIQNVLAEVGGMANAVFAAFLIMITPYARIKFSEAFVNELFEINRKKGNKKKATNNVSRLKKEATTTPEKRKNPPSIPQLKHTDSQGIELQNSNIKLTLQYKNSLPLEKEKSRLSVISAKSNISDNLRRLTAQYENDGLLFPQQQDEELDVKRNSGPRLSYKRAYTQPTEVEHSPRLKNMTGNRTNMASSVLELDDILWQYDPQNNNSRSPEKSVADALEKRKSFEDSDYSAVNAKIPRKEDFLKVDEIPENDQSNVEVEVNKTTQENKKNKPSIKVDVYKTIVRKLSRPKKVKKVRNITISIFEYIWSFVSRSERLKEKMEILNEGLQAANERLDILSLLKKIRDVDKMKGLLLDQDQIFLFDRAERPEIMSRATHWYLEEYMPYDQILHGAGGQILSVQQKIEDKPEKSEMDQKLLNAFS